MEDSKAHEAFVKEYVEKSKTQYERYWRKMIFTGKGMQPKNFKTVEKMVRYIKGKKGTIGYISSDTPAKGVTIIKVAK